MIIKILGAHNIESKTCQCVSLLIDDVLAIEASALTSNLPFSAQQKLKAVLLTHQHYDHVRDIPILGMNFSLHEETIAIYSTRAVYEALTAHLINDIIYPNFTVRPPEKPAIDFKVIEPGTPVDIAGYSVLAVPVIHSVPTVGYQITSADGKTVFYTSDTGPGLADCWRQVSPELIINEVTSPNRYEKFARNSGHLTPALLQRELESFRELKGYIPQVILVHMNPLDEKKIEAEIAVVAKTLNTTIRLGHEGMRIQL
jgi:phosphoribosyl 1,2-cyclic phosphodiesterase